MGWKVNLWARFLDGAHAYRILQNLICPGIQRRQGCQEAFARRVFANMFDAHPPFQIDGNFGAASGIAEMLLQSDDPYATPTSLTAVESGEAAFLHLLPALPSALANGKVSRPRRPRRVRSGDLDGSGGKLVKATHAARRVQAAQSALRGQGNGDPGQGRPDVRSRAGLEARAEVMFLIPLSPLPGILRASQGSSNSGEPDQAGCEAEGIF